MCNNAINPFFLIRNRMLQYSRNILNKRSENNYGLASRSFTKPILNLRLILNHLPTLLLICSQYFNAGSLKRTL